MRILVAGAAGFLGYHLCRRLLDDGHEVVGVDSLATGQPDIVGELDETPGFLWQQADIIEPLSVDGPIDVVFNFACPASPADFDPKGIYILRTCSDGVRNLLDLAGEKNATFVHASTSECYGDPAVHPQPETYWGNVNPVGPRSVYDEGKRFAEALVTAYHRHRGAAVRLCRVFNTYGPRMRLGDGRVLPNFISQGLAGRPLTVFGDGSQTRSLCFVSDLIEGVLRLSECDYSDPVNLGSQDEVTVAELAEEIVALTGGRSEIVRRPLPVDDPKVRRPDIALARKLLNWEPKVPRSEGLAIIIEDIRRRLESSG